MTDAALDALRYPVGKFQPIPTGTKDDRARWIDEIARAPEILAGLVQGLTPAQLGTPYREGGWTVAQTVNHVADSHINAYIRTRFVLTEDDFTVKPYAEAKWAMLADAAALDVSPSIALLRALHTRWVMLLRAITPEQFVKPFTHPESGPMTLDKLIQLYEWHGRHHAAHIRTLKARNGWV